MTPAGMAVSPASVLEALAGVFDPELDEPITELGFVSACEVSADGAVNVGLRLPTPQCAPNFAFLMAADARRVVSALPGVRDVRVALEDHYTGEEINAALTRGEGFTGAFPGETADDDLEALRELFLRKALVARQGRICERLMASGVGRERLVAMRVSELPEGEESRRCVDLRRRLGFDAPVDGPAFVTGDGTGISVDGFERWLRMARLVATSLEANGGICRALLEFRHGCSDELEEVLR
jgi:metal-sulfur cluster biosynthetic enzyme